MSVIRLLPPGAAPQSLIICLHGVGADALSLRPLAQHLQSANPTSAVLIPDAPHPSDLGGVGRQWFSVRGVTNTNRAHRIDAALPWLEAFIESEARELSLQADQVAVCGFSQGAMMALGLAAQEGSPRTIVSIAGRIAGLIALRPDTPIQVLLTHGDRDMVVPFVCLAEAERAFASAGYRVRQAPVHGLGHAIALEQANAAAAFIAECFANTTFEVTA